MKYWIYSDLNKSKDGKTIHVDWSYEIINAETSDWNPSVMCTSKSGNRHSLCFYWVYLIIQLLWYEHLLLYIRHTYVNKRNLLVNYQ